jgi:hypothetical protein
VQINFNNGRFVVLDINLKVRMRSKARVRPEEVDEVDIIVKRKGG